MIKKLPIFLSMVLMSAGPAILAQVEIDRAIQLTGGLGERSISNLELPVNANDAANKAYVDASAGGFAHYIGELFGGGMVAAVWKESGVEHGLIVSLTDIQTSSLAYTMAWSGNTGATIGPSAQSPSDGQANTTAIVAHNNTADRAATVCDSYTNPNTGTGVYSDWYLPSIGELSMCYASKGYLTFAVGTTNGFQDNDYYWSSTENPNSDAWRQSFTNGATGSFGKSNTVRVRAVRRF